MQNYKKYNVQNACFNNIAEHFNKYIKGSAPTL